MTVTGVETRTLVLSRTDGGERHEAVRVRLLDGGRHAAQVGRLYCAESYYPTLLAILRAGTDALGLLLVES